MFSSLRRMIGLIQVTESGNLIRIAGLPGDVVERDIVAMWGTSRIAENMFTQIGASDVSFNRWFAPDVIYAFQRLIDEGGRKHNVRAMKRVIAQMYEHTWLKQTLHEHSKILDFGQAAKFKYSPLEHQERFFKLYNWAVPRYLLNGMLLGAGPGTGKTYMGLVLGAMLHVDSIVTVCPKNAVFRVWHDSISDPEKSLYKRPMVAWTSLDGTPPPRRCSHYIVHFDGLGKFVEQLNHLSLGRLLILLDESHNLNDETSVRAEEFLELCSKTRCKNILWESGTPVKAIGGEMATLLRSIDEMFDKDAQERFRAIYGKASAKANDILAARMGRMTYKVESKSVVKAQGYAHSRNIAIPNGDDYTLDTIREEMRDFVKERAGYYLKNMRQFERLYEDILKSFYKTLTTREQKKEFDQYRHYIKLIRHKYDPVALKQEAIFCNRYEKDAIMPTLNKQSREAFKSVRSIVKYYKLKVQGEALGQILGKKRAECVAAMVPHVEMQKYIDTALKKTVIFTSYVTVVDAVAAHVKKLGYNPLLVYGDTNSQLASIVGKFEKDPDANPLIATYASLSTAVPLVMANEMIMLNSPFRSYERDQATARCVRQGQDQDVNIEDVFLDTGDKPNISTRSRDILTWSRQQVEEILDFKNASFAMESQSLALESAQYWAVMEEFLEDMDGYAELSKAVSAPLWAGGW